MPAELFANVFQTSLASPAAIGDATITTVAPAPAALQVANGQFRILVDSEYMIVTAGAATTTWTVTRAAEGSIAAAHSTGAAVVHILTAAALSALLNEPVVSSQQGAAYTFAAGDAGTVVESTAAGAVTFTVPPHSAVPFPIGTVIEVFQDAAGQVTIAGGAGVTLRSDGGKVHTANQYATVGLRQRAQDEWVLSGDLA